MWVCLSRCASAGLSQNWTNPLNCGVQPHHLISWFSLSTYHSVQSRRILQAANTDACLSGWHHEAWIAGDVAARLGEETWAKLEPWLTDAAFRRNIMQNFCTWWFWTDAWFWWNSHATRWPHVCNMLRATCCVQQCCTNMLHLFGQGLNGSLPTGVTNKGRGPWCFQQQGEGAIPVLPLELTTHWIVFKSNLHVQNFIYHTTHHEGWGGGGGDYRL